ncbi:MAG: NADH-quinone oxidoreductase subunit NuoK [Thermogutta sp.]
MISPITPIHYLCVGIVLFVTGIICLVTKRNIIAILIGVELILNAANVNLVAFSSPVLFPQHVAPLELDGQIFVLFVMILAAAEAAVALAIALHFYSRFGTVDVDQGGNLKG